MSRLRSVLGMNVALCLSLMGLWIIHEAVIDPALTRDLWVLLSGGVFMTFFGGLAFLCSRSALENQRQQRRPEYDPGFR
jgi:hypothetical protein